MRFKWNEENILFLIENYGKINDKEIAKKLGAIDHRSIERKTKELGIWKRKKFSEEEINFIVSHYGKTTSFDLAKKFNKSPHSIRSVWRKHGKCKDIFEWDEEKDRILKEMYFNAPIEEIMEKLGAKKKTVIYSRARKLKINKNPIQYTEEFLINYLQDLSKKIGRTPTVYDIGGISLRPFIDRFGSYKTACIKSGLEPNMGTFNGNQPVLYSKNNDVCYSNSEVIITNFFIDNNISYIKEVPYSSFLPNDKNVGNIISDWIIDGNIVVEFFGMKTEQYKQRMNKKFLLCRKYKVKIIPIYPREIKKLIHKFKFLLNNP